MKALYFAWVRERIGMAEEEIAPPQNVVTVADLMAWLSAKGDNYAAAFAERRTLRAALEKKRCWRKFLRSSASPR